MSEATRYGVVPVVTIVSNPHSSVRTEIPASLFMKFWNRQQTVGMPSDCLLPVAGEGTRPVYNLAA